MLNGQDDADGDGDKNRLVFALRVFVFDGRVDAVCTARAPNQTVTC